MRFRPPYPPYDIPLNLTPYATKASPYHDLEGHVNGQYETYVIWYAIYANTPNTHMRRFGRKWNRPSATLHLSVCLYPLV